MTDSSSFLVCFSGSVAKAELIVDKYKQNARVNDFLFSISNHRLLRKRMQNFEYLNIFLPEHLNISISSFQILLKYCQ